MLLRDRLEYNYNSTLAAAYLATWVCGIVAVFVAFQVLAWSMGAEVNLMDDPPILDALRPLLVTVLLPSFGVGCGYALRFVRGKDDDGDLMIGILAGQGLAFLCLLPAMTAVQANLQTL